MQRRFDFSLRALKNTAKATAPAFARLKAGFFVSGPGFVGHRLQPEQHKPEESREINHDDRQ
jgi:hypothetical protein